MANYATMGKMIIKQQSTSPKFPPFHVLKSLDIRKHTMTLFQSLWQHPTTTNTTEDRKFGTVAGVFIPTVLTILGAIMYLRLGWVVGNAGLVGSLLIIILAHIITISTGSPQPQLVRTSRMFASNSILSQNPSGEDGLMLPAAAGPTSVVAICATTDPSAA